MKSSKDVGKWINNLLIQELWKTFSKVDLNLVQKGFKFVFSFSRVGIRNLISKVFHQRIRVDLKRVLKFKRFKKSC